MSFVSSGPDKQAGMVPYAENCTFNVPFEDFALERPVGRPLEFSLCISGDPEIRPYEEAVPVGCIKKLIAWSDASSPDPDQVYV